MGSGEKSLRADGPQHVEAGGPPGREDRGQDARDGREQHEQHELNQGIASTSTPWSAMARCSATPKTSPIPTPSTAPSTATTTDSSRTIGAAAAG